MSIAVVETVLAGLNVDRDLRDAIIGDLIEERTKLAAAHGEHSADRWIRQQILRSIPSFLRAAVRTGGIRLMAAVVGAAFGALAAVGALIGGSMVLVSAVGSTELVARFAIIALAVDLGYGAVGGYLAARIGHAVPLGAAFMFGVLGLSLTFVLNVEAHGWYRPALQVLLIPATVTGGWLHARHLAQHTRST